MPPVERNQPPEVITKFQDLERVVDELSSTSCVAVDLESDRMYRYRIRTCLIQIAGPSLKPYLVDTVELRDVSPLGPLFENPSIVKIFHNCLQDIQDLKRDFSFRVNNVFDTSVGYRFLHPGNSPGLDKLILKYFDVKISKKYQKANWGIPLTPEMIDYAANDVRYLHDIREILITELKKHELLEEAQEIFEYLSSIPNQKMVFNPYSYLRIKGSMDLEPGQQAQLQKLYLLREDVARKIDRPPYYVLRSHHLYNLVDSPPATKEELSRITRKPNKFLERTAGKILDILHEEELSDEEEPLNLQQISKLRFVPKKKEKKSLSAAQEYRLKILRDYVKDRARKINLDRGLMIPDDVLKLIAKRNPQTIEKLPNVPGFRAKKRNRYGEEIISALKSKNGRIKKKKKN